MSCSSGECFVVLPPYCAENSAIFGRNSVDDDAVEKAQEVIYYDANESSEGKCDGGAEPEVVGSLRVILQKPLPGVWGGDYGANEKDICIGITWTADGPEAARGYLLPTDIVRYVLAAAKSASDAVDQMGSLVAAHSLAKSKANYVVCDKAESWLVSCYGTLWAAQRFSNGFKYFPNNGLLVIGANSIDKSSENLADSLKELGLWNGEGNIDFAACCGATPSTDNAAMWCGDEPNADGLYNLTNMFATLRASAKNKSARSATLSALSANGISSHWFTATPKPCESVFKPFVFAPHPKISPLTKVPPDDAMTLLHRLHAQRKESAVEDLKRVERSCVEEINNYFVEHPSLTDELNELMKDCVEAEVKFYR